MLTIKQISDMGKSFTVDLEILKLFLQLILKMVLKIYYYLL